MYITAGLLIGQITCGRSEDMIRTRIFEPLGMTNSIFSVNELQQAEEYALGYNKDKDDRLVEKPFYDVSNMGPAGSINSSVVDSVSIDAAAGRSRNCATD